MKSILNIGQVRIIADYLVVTVGTQEYRFRVRELSPRLAVASDEEINDFEVSPSGYGIHWRKIDDDISLAALLEGKTL
jgi:hypothetical protein